MGQCLVCSTSSTTGRGTGVFTEEEGGMPSVLEVYDETAHICKYGKSNKMDLGVNPFGVLKILTVIDESVKEF